MADFTPKSDPSKAKGSLARDNTSEHEAPPVMHLEAHHIAKLFKNKLPPIGSKVKVSGLVHVGAFNEGADGPPSGGKAKGGEGNTPRTMSLHFHKMDLGTDTPGEQVDQEEQSKKGAKSAMDKALSRGAGTSEGKGSKGEKELEVSPR
jgi:hypothetical protein